jgi:hypothetical protein
MADRPFARATVTARRITLNPWHPGLINGGPAGDALRRGRRDRVLADLTRLDDGELLVTFVPRDGATDAVRRLLLEWAARVGWWRVWLDDRVIDLGEQLAVSGRARVRCPTCGSRWEDERPEFWDRVRDIGWFPASCPACGGSLPEWEIDERDRAPALTAANARPSMNVSDERARTRL